MKSTHSYLDRNVFRAAAKSSIFPGYSVPRLTILNLISDRPPHLRLLGLGVPFSDQRDMMSYLVIAQCLRRAPLNSPVIVNPLRKNVIIFLCEKILSDPILLLWQHG